jgi:hypothetical protein
MAFGVKRNDLIQWKRQVQSEQIAFITHYWYDQRFPQFHSVTKVGCSNIDKLALWGRQYGLKAEWIDQRGDYPHFDLMGEKQIRILTAEGYFEDIKKFRLEEGHDQ